MNKDAKIYLAGHEGLVGSAFMRSFEENGYKNIITRTFGELDLRRQADVEEFFEKEKPEYVFLAAAKVGGIMANSTYVAEFIYDNTMIASNVIHTAYQCGVKKLLNLGSSCIYPKLAPQPLKEDYLLTGYLETTNEPYAIAKIVAIKLCRYYNQQYGTDFISVMPTNMYGPGDNFNLETSHVLPAMIRKFHMAKQLCSGEISDQKTIDYLVQQGVYADKVVLWGTGSAFREFMHVDDLVRACLFLMENKSSAEIGEIINIGYGKDIQIKELAGLIKNIVGFEGAIDWDDSKPDGTPKKLLDSSRINDLGWSAEIELEQGIKKVYQNVFK